MSLSSEMLALQKVPLQQIMLQKLDIDKWNLDTQFTPFTKINLKWIIDLNIKCKTVKFLEGTRGTNPDNFEYDNNDFLDTEPKAWTMK